MKTNKPVLKPLALVASALLCCALNLPAQPAPTITSQPTNQTVLAGANATFTVAVNGTGPFTYQWQFNGTNLPNNLSGPAGQTIVVDGSTNLVNWMPLFTNTVGVGPLYFFDPAWTNYPWRFYRARLQ